MRLIPILLLSVHHAIAQIITATQTPSTSQLRKLEEDVNNYLTSVDAVRVWTSIGLPAISFGPGHYEAGIEQVNYDITASFPNQADQPTEVVQYVKSVMTVWAQIWNSDVGGAGAMGSGVASTSGVASSPTGTVASATTGSSVASTSGVTSSPTSTLASTAAGSVTAVSSPTPTGEAGMVRVPVAAVSVAIAAGLVAVIVL